MIGVTMYRDSDVAQPFRQSAQEAPVKVKRFVGQLARGPLAQNMIRELSAEARKPRYPLIWTSVRQRKFVMAMLRRQHNIPYQRTGRIRRGWRMVVENAAEGALRVENNERGVQFVQGDRAQRMHLATGHPQAAPIIVKYEPLFQDELIAYWYRLTGAK